MAGGLAAAAAWGYAALPGVTASFSDTREISFVHIHTKETLTVTYKKNGKFVPEAMDQIDWIMRDWRRNEKTKMDSHTIDILWEMHAELGSKQPIQIICGYRSRDTNEMLRRTVGGQASESQHITGKAIDVTFPDVPLKQIRYSALIREQGGVGYYPTSGIPFVHVDTGRVRHWPRLPRYELALLFPNGSSQHNPSDGGPLTKGDVRYAQANHKDLATQIAGFFTLRDSANKSTVMVADATAPTKPQPQQAPAKAPERQMASLMPSIPLPKLVTAPKLVERPSRLTPGPSDQDRSQLMTLVSFVAESEKPSPKLVSGPAPVSRNNTITRGATPRTEGSRADTPPVTGAEQSQLIALAPSSPRTRWTQVAALDPATFATANEGGSPVMTDANRSGWSNGWVTAPAYDDEHPEELSYRPFPLAPMLTASASINEPVLARMKAPDVAKILQQIDQPWTVPQMHFLPGEQTAEVLWAQQFQGQSVQLIDHSLSDGAQDVPTKLIPRSVKTTAQ